MFAAQLIIFLPTHIGNFENSYKEICPKEQKLSKHEHFGTIKNVEWGLVSVRSHNMDVCRGQNSWICWLLWHQNVAPRTHVDKWSTQTDYWSDTHFFASSIILSFISPFFSLKRLSVASKSFDCFKLLTIFLDCAIASSYLPLNSSDSGVPEWGFMCFYLYDMIFYICVK